MDVLHAGGVMHAWMDHGSARLHGWVHLWGCVVFLMQPVSKCLPNRGHEAEFHTRRGLHVTETTSKASATVTGSPIPIMPSTMPRSGTCVILGGFGFPNRRCSINSKAMGAQINLLVRHPLPVPVVVPEPPGSAPKPPSEAIHGPPVLDSQCQHLGRIAH